MEIYVKNGEVLIEKPPEGTYGLEVTVCVTESDLLKFFSECLEFYCFCKSSDSDDSFAFVHVLEVLSSKAGVSHLFESYFKQVEDYFNGKES